jgi:8-oxo-dGTP pyrophosphatase MutT (NUDIX family)
MHRRPLLELLDAYQPLDDGEAHSHARIVDFVRRHTNCFERTCAPGHITASAWLIHPHDPLVLLTHHRKLCRWLQPGGHADGDTDVMAVALRQASEESGIHDIQPVSTTIFDVDVHLIPARTDEPAHEHFDMRFLLRVESDPTFAVSEESLDLGWFDADQLMIIDTDESVLRMRDKWLDHMSRDT